ncbi:MAG: ParB/RepB/Spo0J family partition protein [Chloroflexi bacterium]|nr:ParB/RepB/Spo0J family partition protein [Chloroflexota bacterium]
MRLLATPSRASAEPLQAQPQAVAQLPLEQIHEPVIGVRQDYDADGLQELASSLRQHGQLQAICVRPLGPDRFEAIYGVRRLRAARLAGWTRIACTLRVDLSEDRDDALVLSLVENLQRRDLGGAERAHALRLLAARYVPASRGGGVHDLQPDSMSGLGRQLAVSRKTVARWLGIAGQPAVLQAVEDGRLALAHAGRVASAPREHVGHVLEEAIDRQLTVAAIEERVRQLRCGQHAPSANVRALRQALSALERVHEVDGEQEQELLERLWRSVSRLHDCRTGAPAHTQSTPATST